MHLAGSTQIAARRQRVWDAISHPDRATASTSQGSATVERIDDRHYRVSISANAGLPVQFTLDLSLIDVAEPGRITAEVQGSVMGGPIRGAGSIELAELGPVLTAATYEADVTLGGMLAGIEPMLAGPLQQAADGAVASLKERLEAEEKAAS